MLKVENISAGYGEKQVLYDISFEVNEGEVVLLTGGNGSGKSTLLRCVFNLIKLWKGAIYFEDNRIDMLSSSDLIQMGIVYIPQKEFCFENLTVEQNLRIAGNIYDNNELVERIAWVYETTSLEQLKNRKPYNLSGGEKKLLGFAMGLIHKPKLLLFDEPLAGIDSTRSVYILSLLDKIFRENKIGILIVEHDKRIKEFYTKKIIMILGKLTN